MPRGPGVPQIVKAKVLDARFRQSLVRVSGIDDDRKISGQTILAISDQSE
jgi:exosome complex RNA-binding protein Csl4